MAAGQPNNNYAQQVFWDERGNPYWEAPTFKSGEFTGNQKFYLAPAAAATESDPRLREWAAATDAVRPGSSAFHGKGVWDTERGKWNTPRGDSLFTLGVGGLLGAGAASVAGLFGAGAGASTGAGSSASSLLPAKLGADAAPSLFGGGGGMLGGLGRFLMGINPTTAVLGGLSLLGGGGGQDRNSFTGRASPQAVLQRLLTEIDALGGDLRSRGPARLSAGSVVQQGIKPITIPGLPFQIGGGLAQDPAAADPSILESKRGPKLRKP